LKPLNPTWTLEEILASQRIPEVFRANQPDTLPKMRNSLVNVDIPIPKDIAGLVSD
jgi:hypothetical protein